jgi:hypothetical protein
MARYFEWVAGTHLPYSWYEKSFRKTRRNGISLVFFSPILLQANVFDWHPTCR